MAVLFILTVLSSVKSNHQPILQAACSGRMEETMTNTNMANREVCDLIFVDYATKKPFLNLDFANVTTTELTGESVFAYGGKGHPKRMSFSGERDRKSVV